jgi:hypothetical protein
LSHRLAFKKTSFSMSRALAKCLLFIDFKIHFPIRYKLEEGKLEKGVPTRKINHEYLNFPLNLFKT